MILLLLSTAKWFKFWVSVCRTRDNFYGVMIHVLDDEQEVHFEEGASETGYKSISFVPPKPAARAEFQLRLPMPAGMMAQPVEPGPAQARSLFFCFTDIF